MIALGEQCPGFLLQGNPLSPGDIAVYFRNGYNQPSDPYWVGFTLYYVHPDTPDPLLVGCPDRTPVKAGPGWYYVSGVAGSGGQSGCWRIRWSWRENAGDPLTSVDSSFRVVPSFHPSQCSCCVSGW